MVTARILVTDALDLLGIHAAEEPLSAHQEQQGLRVLNDLIQSASLEHFTLYYTPAVVIEWPAGKRMLTWGPGGDIASERPVQLALDATCTDAVSGIVYPLPVWPLADFRLLPWPDFAGEPMQALSYAASYPLGELYGYPVPLTAGQVTVYPWLVLREWPDFDTDVGMPPGYARYLTAALSCDLAGYYDKEPSAIVQGMRIEARDRIKTANVSIPTLAVPWFADPYNYHSSGDIRSWPR